jgi:hypothetical protein
MHPRVWQVSISLSNKSTPVSIRTSHSLAKCIPKQEYRNGISSSVYSALCDAMCAAPFRYVEPNTACFVGVTPLSYIRLYSVEQGRGSKRSIGKD